MKKIKVESGLLTPNDIQMICSTRYITILLTKKCNLNCSYCDVIKKDQNTRSITLLEFNKILDFIEFQSDMRPNLNIHFFGGEPTLNPNLIDMIKSAKQRLDSKINLNLQMTSNLEKHIKYFNELTNLIIVASYHSEKANPYEWFKKAKLLEKKNMLYHAVLMVTKTNMIEILILYLKWKKYFKCVLVPIDEILETKEYKKFKTHVITLLNKNPFEHDAEQEIFFGERSKTIMCSSGIIVDEFGNIHSCWPKINKNIFNIFDDQYKKISQYHMCRNFGDNCDLEVIRTSLDFYKSNLKTQHYVCNENKEIRCNG